MGSGEIWVLRKADPMDRLHLGFFKSVLGVKSRTPTCFVYGELGLYSLIIERKVNVLQYWAKIIRSLNYFLLILITTVIQVQGHFATVVYCEGNILPKQIVILLVKPI